MRTKNTKPNLFRLQNTNDVHGVDAGYNQMLENASLANMKYTDPCFIGLFK